MTPKETEARREALRRELFEVGHRLGMPTSEGQKARNDRMAELQRQIAELPEPEPPVTGMRAGIVRIGPAPLGDPWTPPPKEPDARELARGDDPFFRFAGEQGWENK